MPRAATSGIDRHPGGSQVLAYFLLEHWMEAAMPTLSTAQIWITEGMRDVVDDAMDVRAGSGIIRGPRNTAGPACPWIEIRKLFRPFRKDYLTAEESAPVARSRGMDRNLQEGSSCPRRSPSGLPPQVRFGQATTAAVVRAVPPGLDPDGGPGPPAPVRAFFFRSNRRCLAPSTRPR